MINIRSIQKLINEVRKNVDPKIFFAFTDKERVKAEAEATNNDIVFVYTRNEDKDGNKLKTGMDYMTEEERREFIDKMSKIPGGEYIGRENNN